MTLTSFVKYERAYDLRANCLWSPVMSFAVVGRRLLSNKATWNASRVGLPLTDTVQLSAVTSFPSIDALPVTPICWISPSKLCRARPPERFGGAMTVMLQSWLMMKLVLRYMGLNREAILCFWGLAFFFRGRAAVKLDKIQLAVWRNIQDQSNHE